MNQQELLDAANKASRLISEAKTILLSIQDGAPQLDRKRIGSPDELISNLWAADDICDHLIGNIKAMKE